MAFLEYNPTAPLFHYTTQTGFKGIVESGSVWLNDLQHSNDPKELQLATHLPDLIAELAKEEKDAQRQTAYLQVGEKLQRLRERFGIYTFSLSRLGDKLPMWQEYTDRGRGYCVQFRPSAFNKMNLRIQRVQYVDAFFFDTLRSKVKDLIAPHVGVQVGTIESIQLITPIITLMTCVKNDAWVHEDEVRLVFSSMASPNDFKPNETKFPIGLGPDGSEIMPSFPEYRQSNGQNIRYFIQNFGRYLDGRWNSKRSIEKVILGCNNPFSVSETEEYMNDLGYLNFHVTRSECSFRP